MAARVAAVCAALAGLRIAHAGDRRTVAVVSLTDDAVATKLHKLLYDQLQTHWALRTLGDPTLATVLQGPLVADDGEDQHLKTAKEDLARAEDYLSQFDYARATTSGKEPNLRITSHHGLAALEVPVDANAQARPAAFAGVGADAAKWGGQSDATHVGWVVQSGEELEWGRTYVYTLTAKAPPQEGIVQLSDAGSPRATVTIPALAPIDADPIRRRPATLGVTPPR